MKKLEECCAWILTRGVRLDASFTATLLGLSVSMDRKQLDNLFYEEFGLSCKDAIETCQRGIVKF